jgi:hypothetical protein
VENPHLTIERRTLPAVLWFGLEGTLETADVGAVATILSLEAGEGTRDVHLDVSKLHVIPGAGVEMFTALAHRLTASGRTLNITTASPTTGPVDGLTHPRPHDRGWTDTATAGAPSPREGVSR